MKTSHSDEKTKWDFSSRMKLSEKTSHSEGKTYLWLFFRLYVQFNSYLHTLTITVKC